VMDGMKTVSQRRRAQHPSATGTTAHGAAPTGRPLRRRLPAAQLRPPPRVPPEQGRLRTRHSAIGLVGSIILLAGLDQHRITHAEQGRVRALRRSTRSLGRRPRTSGRSRPAPPSDPRHRLLPRSTGLAAGLVGRTLVGPFTKHRRRRRIGPLRFQGQPTAPTRVPPITPSRAARGYPSGAGQGRSRKLGRPPGNGRTRADETLDNVPAAGVIHRAGHPEPCCPSAISAGGPPGDPRVCGDAGGRAVALLSALWGGASGSGRKPFTVRYR
jgi:hypothetical protein